MRERTKLLFEQPGDDYTLRTRNITLNDDIDKFELLRIYLSFGADGLTVIETPVGLFDALNTTFMWTYHIAGGGNGTIGSQRINLYRRDANNKRNLTIMLTRLTYLNAGTAAYTEQANNQWGPVPIYKIIGVYKEGITE